MKLLVLLLTAVTFYLVGLIWTIQVVHYPLFADVGTENYVRYQAGHQWRITTIVLPTMMAELALAGLLILARPPEFPLWAAIVGFALVLLIWAATFFLSVPQHSVLDRGFDATAHRLLVDTNWVRTIAWTARGALMLWVVARMLK